MKPVHLGLSGGAANSKLFLGGLATAGAVMAAIAASSEEAEMAYGPIAAISDVRFMEGKISDIEVCHFFLLLFKLKCTQQ